MPKVVWAALGLALLLFTGRPAAAQTRLFSDSSEIAITLEGPLSTIQRAAARSTDPRPGAVVLAGAPAQRFNVEIAARGHVRRTGGFCSLPPLRLSFEREQVRGTLFQGQRKLKLVAPCRPGDAYQQLIVLEYIAYELYNQVTPLSFRARPVRVTYRDTDAGGREVTRLGFFLEDEDDVARRNHRTALEVQSRAVSVDQLDPEMATRAALFEYMIGNLDWDMLAAQAGQSCCHNFRLMTQSGESGGRIAPTPYDFDYSGLVSAPYAAPPEGIRIPNVRVRYYRGYCRFNDRLPAVIADLRARRAALYQPIDGETRLSDSRRRAARRYLDDFFAVLDDPARIERELTGHCRRG
jgi:hypothetical protein